MAHLTLTSFPGDFRALKALIAAEYNGVAIAKPAFDLAKDGSSPAFLAKSPSGKVPVLETSEGCLWESNAIARFVARIRRDTELMGRSFFESGLVESWLDWSSSELELPASLCCYPLLGWSDFPGQAVHDKATGDLHKALATLEKHLLSRTFLVAERISLADIAVVCGLFYPFKLVLDADAREAYPSVTRWFHTCVNQPHFAAVLGEVPFCEEAAVAAGADKSAAVAAAKKAIAAANKGGAAKGGDKKEKAKAEEKPKAAKKEEKPKKEKDEDAPPPMMDIPKEEKKKDPLAELPKSSMNLDEWKRHYSNTKPHIGAMPWFWEKLDREGWSLWKQDYNYNTENTRDFMTSNLVGGFIQRSDEVRRYAFGQMYVLNPPADAEASKKFYEVTGMWLMRGHSIQPMLDSNPDAEYYTWKKMNPEDAADRTLVEAYWAEPAPEESLLGKVVYDSRVFK